MPMGIRNIIEKTDCSVNGNNYYPSTNKVFPSNDATKEHPYIRDNS